MVGRVGVLITFTFWLKETVCGPHAWSDRGSDLELLVGLGLRASSGRGPDGPKGERELVLGAARSVKSGDLTCTGLIHHPV